MRAEVISWGYPVVTSPHPCCLSLKEAAKGGRRERRAEEVVLQGGSTTWSSGPDPGLHAALPFWNAVCSPGPAGDSLAGPGLHGAFQGGGTLWSLGSAALKCYVQPGASLEFPSGPELHVVFLSGVEPGASWGLPSWLQAPCSAAALKCHREHGASGGLLKFSAGPVLHAVILHVKCSNSSGTAVTL